MNNNNNNNNNKNNNKYISAITEPISTKLKMIEILSLG